MCACLCPAHLPPWPTLTSVLDGGEECKAREGGAEGGVDINAAFWKRKVKGKKEEGVMKR